MDGLNLPQLPVPHRELVRYIANHADTPMVEPLQPYRNYESKLRQLYAQDAANEALNRPKL